MANKNEPRPEELEIKIWDIDDLSEAQYNPRTISREEYSGIRKSIRENGFLEPIHVNVHPDRHGIIIAGHRRVEVLKELGYTKVPVIEHNVDEEKEKELNVLFNSGGEFDKEKLNFLFTAEQLEELGKSRFIIKQDDEYVKKLNSITNADAEMPIVPKFSEKYLSIVIFCENELDYNYMRNVLRLDRRKDFKNTRVAETQVITAKDFQKIWEDEIEGKKAEV